MKKTFTILFLSASIVLSMMPSVFASETSATINTNYEIALASSYFSDIEQSKVKLDIEYLVGRDVVKGYENGLFRPNAPLKYTEAIQLVTKSFDLKLNKSMDVSLEDIDEDKWYSEAFAIALSHHMDVDSFKNANDNITREQFAGWIIDELDRIGVYPVVRMFINIADSEQISEKYSNKVQTLLLTRIASLSEEQTFRPKEVITREEAADWLADAVKFADTIRAQQIESNILSDLSFEFSEDMNLTADQAQTLISKVFSQREKDESIEASTKVTREKFASWIIDELNIQGPYPVKMMFIHIADEQDITEEVSYKVQTLLLTDIATLNEQGEFKPQAEITGAEAVVWLQHTVEFMNRFK